VNGVRRNFDPGHARHTGDLSQRGSPDPSFDHAQGPQPHGSARCQSGRGERGSGRLQRAIVVSVNLNLALCIEPRSQRRACRRSTRGDADAVINRKQPWRNPGAPRRFSCVGSPGEHSPSDSPPSCGDPDQAAEQPREFLCPSHRSYCARITTPRRMHRRRRSGLSKIPTVANLVSCDTPALLRAPKTRGCVDGNNRRWLGWVRTFEAITFRGLCWSNVCQTHSRCAPHVQHVGRDPVVIEDVSFQWPFRRTSLLYADRHSTAG
jgi:hypothetical protein